MTSLYEGLASGAIVDADYRPCRNCRVQHHVDDLSRTGFCVDCCHLSVARAGLPMPFVYDDGGRAAAGYRGEAGDCACRAVAIVTGILYEDVYRNIIVYAESERPREKAKRSHPRTGVHARTLGRYLATLGFIWTPTMAIGSGTTVHVRPDELPTTGRHVLRLSRHFAALVDGVIHDTHDPSRDGDRAVYGFWSAP